MNEVPNHIASIAHVIQLAVAPVFLLAGVGALLGVLTNRLARIVDHFNRIEKSVADAPDIAANERNRNALFALSRRARLIHWAITFSAGCYLLVCTVVVLLFVGHEINIDVSRAIGALFITAMLALICALSCFLREISIGTSVIENIRHSAYRIGQHRE